MTDLDPLASRMDLCWAITCSRCTSEQYVDRPDDLREAVKILRDEGWTAQERETSKRTMAHLTDTSDWPDTLTYVMCPRCSGGDG